MEFIRFIIDKVFSVKSWKQLLMLCFIITYLILAVVVFENRDSIFRFKRFSIPDSQVQNIQKDLEMEKILNKLLFELRATRVYLVKFRPEFGEDNLTEEIKVYLTHEQTDMGVKSIKELYEGTLMTRFHTDWAELYYEGFQRIDVENSKVYPFIEYHLEKANSETFYQFAIYSAENKVTHSLIVEFTEDKILDEVEEDFVRKHLNILGHYLK